MVLRCDSCGEDCNRGGNMVLVRMLYWLVVVVIVVEDVVVLCYVLVMIIRALCIGVGGLEKWCLIEEKKK